MLAFDHRVEHDRGADAGEGDDDLQEPADQDGGDRAGAGAAGLVTAKALTSMYGWAFLFSGTLMPALNALLLGSLLYRSRLVPRALPTIGLIGAPLLLASVIGILFGAFSSTSPPALLLAIPIAVWEFSLGVYLIVKGFKPSPITAGITTAGAQPATT